MDGPGGVKNIRVMLASASFREDRAKQARTQKTRNKVGEENLLRLKKKEIRQLLCMTNSNFLENGELFILET